MEKYYLNDRAVNGLVVNKESSAYPYLMKQESELLVNRSWDLRVIVGHTCQHGYMISLCSHWELS